MNYKKCFTHQNFLKKNSGGFTLVELMVVIAIIGILSAVILISINSGQTKAQIAAFKAEATGTYPGLTSQCDSNTITAPTATKVSNVATWVAGKEGNLTNICGPSGTGNWAYTVTSKYTAANTACGTATVSPTGVSFSVAGC